MVPPLRAAFSPALSKRASQPSFTARIERAPLYRAHSASKKGSWLRPSPPWLLQKQSHSYLLPLDPGATEGLDDLASQHFRHFH